MARTRKEFFYNKDLGLEMNGAGMIMTSYFELEEFLVDLSVEVLNATGYSSADDYSFYINYDKTFAIDSKNSEVADKVTEYVYDKYDIVFLPKVVRT